MFFSEKEEMDTRRAEFRYLWATSAPPVAKCTGGDRISGRSRASWTASWILF